MKVDYVDHMGSDLSVVNAARVSFDKESEWETVSEGEYDYERLSDRDTKLINYLAKHNHWTPFAHTAITLRIKAPLFVARQLGKHQVGLVWNEVSRRYVDSEPEFYTPRIWRKRADNVKQGSSDEPVETIMFQGVTESWTDDPSALYVLHIDHCERLYNSLIEGGVCPEQARMVLPQSMYTEWYWTGNVASAARVCKLRLDSHTQKETRDVGELMSKVIQPLFPVSWKALMGDLVC